MKNIRTAKSARNLPPYSAALLILALCLAIAAVELLEINRAPLPSPEAAPSELKAADSPASQAGYRPHRHRAAPLGESVTAERATRYRAGGSIMKRAIL